MKVRLGNYINEYSVRNKNDENIPVYSVTNTKGFCRDYFGKEVASKDKTTYKIVPRGYFAFNPSRINVGSVDWQRNEDRVIVSPLYNVFSVSPQLDQQYLYYYLKSDFVLQRIRAVATGSVRDNLKLAMLYEFPIRLPSIERQKEMAERLDKVKNVIALREQEYQRLDELIKARFVEMFGNEKKLMTMNEVCAIITDGTHQPPKFSDAGIPFIFVSNITGDKITYDAEKFIDQDTYDVLIKRTPIEIGDILLSTVGSYGHPAVVKTDKRFLFQRHIAYLKPKKELVDSDYLHGAILSPDAQRQIEEGVKGIAQKTLNLSEIKKMKIPVPSLDRQKEFAVFVLQVDKSKAVIQKSLEEAQLLFDSLMQQYFG